MFKRSLTVWGGFALLLSVAACADPNGQPAGTTDLPDKVRQIDLSARYPIPEQPKVGANGRGGPGYEIYGSKAVPGGASARPAGGPIPGVQEAGGDSYTLNFENAEIQAVVRAVLGDILKVNYSIDPKVTGAVSLSSAQPVSRQDVVVLLEAALRIVDAALLRDGTGYKVLPTSDATGAAAVDTPDRLEPGYGLTVIQTRHISAQAMVQLLDNFATKPGMIRADQKHNFVVVQGTTTERRTLIDMAHTLDADWMKNQSVGIFPVSNSTPDTIIAEVNKIIDSKQGGDEESGIRLQPISRMNAVLAVARSRSDIEKIATWIKRLDRADYLNTSLRVYHLRFGEAKKIASMLNEVFTGRHSSSGSDSKATDQLQPGSDLSGGSSSSFGSSNNQRSSNPTTTPPSTAGTALGAGTSGTKAATDSDPFRGAFEETSGGSASGGGGRALLPDVRIAPDIVNNALLILASRENYRLIEQAILELDRPPLQVAIDVTIAEVRLNDELRYGVQYYLSNSSIGAHRPFGVSLDYPSGSSATPAASGGTLGGLVPGVNMMMGSVAHPNVVLDALRGVTSVKVLSSPSLVVLDNQLAVLQVGDQIPIETRTATYLDNTSNTGTGVSTPIVNNVEYRDTGVILRVLPRINANGMVALNVEQETSDVSQTTASASSGAPNLTPTISQRKIKSAISVTTGQTVLLGGLMKETQQDIRNGVPLLSDIPVLGNLFSHKDATTARTELIVFIRPQIIRNSADAQIISEELRTKLEMIRSERPTLPAKKS